MKSNSLYWTLLAFVVIAVSGFDLLEEIARVENNSHTQALCVKAKISKGVEVDQASVIRDCFSDREYKKLYGERE